MSTSVESSPEGARVRDAAQLPPSDGLGALVVELYDRFRTLRDGAVADYIPGLAKADPEAFGIGVMTTSGEWFAAGDVERPFTIQSIAKPFVYALALADHGREYVLTKVGVEPTGDAFNSIIQLERQSNRPHNPMVNAGAIAAASLVKGADPSERLSHVLETFARFAGRELSVDATVYASERKTGHRNRALAHLMLNFGMIDEPIEDTLELYFQACSVRVTCRDLASMAATLANGGVHPVTGARAIDPRYVQDLLSVMYTCGMYDYAGQWAYDVGLPAKSGVGGGILAVAPARMGIAAFSPPIDSCGHSVRGIKVCEQLSHRLGLHVFGPRRIASA